MLKVCFISPEYLPLSGGTVAYVYYLSKELMKRGNSIGVVTASDETRDAKVTGQHRVFFLKTLKIPIVKSFQFAGSSSRKLNKIRGDFPADIVHTNLPLAPSFAVPADFGETLVSTVHSTWKGEAE